MDSKTIRVVRRQLHRCVAIILYDLTPDEAFRAWVGERVSIFGTGHVVGPVCYWCHKDPGEAGRSCPGESDT